MHFLFYKRLNAWLPIAIEAVDVGIEKDQTVGKPLLQRLYLLIVAADAVGGKHANGIELELAHIRETAFGNLTHLRRELTHAGNGTHTWKTAHSGKATHAGKSAEGGNAHDGEATLRRKATTHVREAAERRRPHLLPLVGQLLFLLLAHK